MKTLTERLDSSFQNMFSSKGPYNIILAKMPGTYNCSISYFKLRSLISYCMDPLLFPDFIRWKYEERYFIAGAFTITFHCAARDTTMTWHQKWTHLRPLVEQTKNFHKE